MNNYRRFYEQLNDLQREAVDTVDGPLLITAGPGTGKTQLLSVRAGSIVDKGKASPENILVLTYTNSAAKAMKERLAKIIGRLGYDVCVSTFHGFANSILQESEESANYVGDKIQLSDVERMRIIEYILDNTDGLETIRPFGAPYNYLKEILGTIGDIKREGIKPDDLKRYLDLKNSGYRDMEEKYREKLAAFSVVYEKYEELKAEGVSHIFDERGRYDFDDMIIYATEALSKEKSLREEYAQQYRYAMIDEYQDTNGSQLGLLFSIFNQKKPNLCFVGDDDQSIYRFQGAGVGNFRFLRSHFPALKVISLNDNYRSSKTLIEASGAIINTIPPSEREGGKSPRPAVKYSENEILFREFTTEEEELLFIIDKVRELKEKIENDPALSDRERSKPYNNIAVLVRKRKDILKVIDSFLRAGIPYATDGKEDISGEKRVRQLLDVLDLINIDPAEVERKDAALYRVLSSDYLGIPHSDILDFMNRVNIKRKTDGAVTFLSEFLSYAASASAKSGAGIPEKSAMKKAANIIKDLFSDAASKSIHTLLLSFIKNSGLYRFVLSAYSENGVLRIRQLRAVGSFVNMVKSSDISNPAIRLSDFMQEMKTKKEHALPIQGDLVTMTQEGVRIYTAHGAKGLEFRAVIIPFCLHNRNWPAKPMPQKIKLPSDLFKTRDGSDEKERLKELTLQDETRLFYVAMTRAKSDLIFTASPTESSVPSPYLSKLNVGRESADLRTPDEAPLFLQKGRDEEGLLEKSIELTDSSDPFIGTEEVLSDMITNLSLNPTRLNTYIDCRRKFLYNDILKLPGVKKRSLVFGNCVHKALEDTYRSFMDKKKFPPFRFFEDSFKRELIFQGVDKTMQRELLNKLGSLAPWFKKASREKVMPISLERKLMITVGDDIIFTGKYDKVEWSDEKNRLVRIIDYKTGKPDKHLKEIDEESDIADPECDGYLRQLACYRLLFERDKKESRGRRVDSGELVFIEPVSEDIRKLGYKKGDYAVKIVGISDAMLETLEELIISSWHDIKKLRFEKLPCRDKIKCARCDFDALCWGDDNA